MILDRLENAERYLKLHPLFQRVFAELAKRPATAWHDGREDFAGEQCYASVAANAPKKREAARLEGHRKYIDVQVILAGEEEIGWRSRGECTTATNRPEDCYDGERDLEFFEERPQAWCRLTAGSFAIFFPEDAHAPGVSEKEVRKIVFKVALA